jgi:hypothetical protein
MGYIKVIAISVALISLPVFLLTDAENSGGIIIVLWFIAIGTAVNYRNLFKKSESELYARKEYWEKHIVVCKGEKLEKSE